MLPKHSRYLNYYFRLSESQRYVVPCSVAALLLLSWYYFVHKPFVYKQAAAHTKIAAMEEEIVALCHAHKKHQQLASSLEVKDSVVSIDAPEAPTDVHEALFKLFDAQQIIVNRYALAPNIANAQHETIQMTLQGSFDQLIKLLQAIPTISNLYLAQDCQIIRDHNDLYTLHGCVRHTLNLLQ